MSILISIKVHGRDFLSKVKVNGMYAFVAYDEEKDEYIVARDPVGIIPLYMGWGSDGSIWFASEMKALQENCDHFEIFPPGHYYVGRSLHNTNSKLSLNNPTTQEGIYGELKPFYKEKWFSDPAASHLLPKSPKSFQKVLLKPHCVTSRAATVKKQFFTTKFDGDGEVVW